MKPGHCRQTAQRWAHLHSVLDVTSLAVSEGDFPAAVRFGTAVDAVRLIVDGFLEGIFIGCGIFVGGLALVRIAILARVVIGTTGGRILFRYFRWRT